MSRRHIRCLILIAVGIAPVSMRAQQARSSGFDHDKHRRLFPTCIACHEEPAFGEGPLYPDPVKCAACHDGSIEPRVTWQPPQSPHATNLRFDHALVPVMTRAGQPDPPTCTVCHGREGAGWMAVQRINQDRCLACHRITTAHLAAPDSACTVCHLPLTQATALTRDEIARFPVPPSHREAGWVAEGVHGRAAQSASGRIAARCTICHAREFCLQCHVDAPDHPVIQSLPSDARATAIAVQLRPPASHSNPAFLTRHGGMAQSNAARCATCHARESCLACHAGTPRVVAFMPARAPGRGVGAVIERHRPASHGQNFAREHAALASRNPATCAGCHVRADCLECHRPDPGASPGYHPAGFLTRHPAAAYARETSCADCHNTAGFCTTCHAAAGLRSAGALRPGYHDANQFFIGGHGQAARQSLESCTACHVERDCLTCHSANGGRRFDPHGPGFDAERLRRKNPQMCTACHGAAIPTQ